MNIWLHWEHLKGLPKVEVLWQKKTQLLFAKIVIPIKPQNSDFFVAFSATKWFVNELVINLLCLLRILQHHIC